MAAPVKSGKAPVSLAGKGVRVSKIRRDPPPVARKTVVPDRDEVDRRSVAIGAATSWAGWNAGKRPAVPAGVAAQAA